MDLHWIDSGEVGIDTPRIASTRNSDEITMKEILIRVSDEAARAYEGALPQERRKLDALLSLRLAEATHSSRTLEEVMDEIGAKTRERGLTPEKLDEILNAAD